MRRASRGLLPAPAPVLALSALTLAVLVLARVAFASADSTQTCLTHGEEARKKGAVVRTVSVWLLWESPLAHAAAALLRAVLLGAGHQPEHVTLNNTAASRDLCTLLNHSLARYDEEMVVVVTVAVSWSAPRQPHRDSRNWCKWTGRWLEVLGAGAAPLAPRLHVHLAPGVTRALTLPGYSLPVGTEDEKEMNATVYIPKGEWKNETDNLCRRMHCKQLARDHLANLVATANHSFLFFDAELWHNESSVSLVPAAPDEPPSPVSLLVAARTALLERAPALYKVLHQPFAPWERDLRYVLEDVARNRTLDVAEAACKRAPAAAGYPSWRKTASESSIRQAIVVVCNSEPRDDYELAVKYFTDHLNYTTDLFKLRAWFITRIVTVDCGDPSALALKIDNWRNSGRLWRTVGVAAPANQVRLAALNAESARLVLVAYTPASAPVTAGYVRSATGSPETLARALRRLLDACGWARLGLVSENTPLARAVRDALLGAGDLNAYEAMAMTPNETVKELRGLDTRVFFVNGNDAMTRDVLEAAVLFAKPGDADKHVWIVRDYEAPDAVTAALRPLSVSFQWRGEEPLAARGSSLRRLESEWRGRAWPRHAAAILDALITLGEGFERLVKQHNETLDHPQMKEKLSYFWEGVQERPIPGVVEDLKYLHTKIGVEDARVYIERWDSGMQLRRLAAWQPSDGRCAASGLPSDDGSTHCLMPYDSRYYPRCHDVAWISSIVALAAVLAALCVAAVATRRWLARRDHLLQRATTARILAQREATVAELAPYLVESTALVQGEELGAGRFGIVRRGEVRSARRRAAGRAVAVKALREGASPAEESQFLREARLLATLEHEHVVRFEGVCWEGGPPLLLMELALFGDLLRYLRARRHLAEGAPGAQLEEAAAVSSEALTRLAREAAEALAYLGARGLVHRDVRAANCLVDANRSLKLADFGLARETGAADGEYACRGRALFPVLWMAPESLARGVATAASDSWSFGVLALELVTLGARPFGGAAPEAAVHTVLAGGRPPLPRDACAETRALALACWRREPTARPSAARLAAWLARRRSALRPALAPDLEEPDCDSGIGEPEPLLRAPRDSPTSDTRHSPDLLTLAP